MSDYTEALANVHQFEPGIVTAGQPTAEQLEAAQAQGVKTVINLRTNSEKQEFDEAALAKKVGMNYVHIPVAGPDDINDANARLLDEALAPGALPALVHCGSANRVGALIAYRARFIQHKNDHESLGLGIAAGLDPDSPLLDAVAKKIG
jgi:uncharacterized protein (TIGR01244 family)